MTQIELELKNNQLFRAYCAQANPLKQELAENDIKVREVRQNLARLYDELHDLRDHRVEIERKLRELKTEHMEHRAVVLQEYQASLTQSATPSNAQDAQDA